MPLDCASDYPVFWCDGRSRNLPEFLAWLTTASNGRLVGYRLAPIPDWQWARVLVNRSRHTGRESVAIGWPTMWDGWHITGYSINGIRRELVVTRPGPNPQPRNVRPRHRPDATFRVEGRPAPLPQLFSWLMLAEHGDTAEYRPASDQPWQLITAHVASCEDRPGERVTALPPGGAPLFVQIGARTVPLSVTRGTS